MAATDSMLVKALIVGGEAGLIILLIVTIVYPLVKRRKETDISIHRDIMLSELQHVKQHPFKKIALALDYGTKDRNVIQYALQFAEPNTEFVLIHIVESASAKLIGEESEDYETRKDKEMLSEYVTFFEEKKYKVTAMLGYRNRTKEIARIVKDSNADLLILGSHGHKGLTDIVWGETINQVRHLINIPVFIAK
jgi:manganese transport protein